MVEELDENRLIAACKAGDHDAFEVLVRENQQMIHALAFRMTGSASDAEDLAQETFLAAFRKLPDFRGDARFSSWLYRIGVNLALNWRQNEARRSRTHTDWAARATLEHASEISTDGSMSERAQEALLRLSSKQRAAIVLTVYDGLNHAEAARILDCSETTVSWRVFSARRKLKRWLDDRRARSA
jgi:RNA polymerase sigma-70 factor (ECF subfamily)